MKCILKHGEYGFVSCKCGCEFTFEKSDLNEDNKVECPECGELVAAKVKEEK